jgi:hypothetical protein
MAGETQKEKERQIRFDNGRIKKTVKTRPSFFLKYFDIGFTKVFDEAFSKLGENNPNSQKSKNPFGIIEVNERKSLCTKLNSKTAKVASGLSNLKRQVSASTIWGKSSMRPNFSMRVGELSGESDQ